MSSIQSQLTRLSKLSSHSSIFIADGRACPIVGHSEVNPTSSLKLSQVLYFPNFHVTLLFINAITKALFCSISFFPYHCTFQDLQTGKRIGLGYETRYELYKLVPHHFPARLSFPFLDQFCTLVASTTWSSQYLKTLPSSPMDFYFFL